MYWNDLINGHNYVITHASDEWSKSVLVLYETPPLDDTKLTQFLTQICMELWGALWICISEMFWKTRYIGLYWAICGYEKFGSPTIPNFIADSSFFSLFSSQPKHYIRFRKQFQEEPAKNLKRRVGVQYMLDSRGRKKQKDEAEPVKVELPHLVSTSHGWSGVV